MKLQFSGDTLRIRLDPPAFAMLRAGEPQSLDLPFAGGIERVELHAAEAFGVAGGGGVTRIALPVAELDALAARLPSREGLRWAGIVAGRALDVVLEVDVRGARGDRRHAPR